MMNDYYKRTYFTMTDCHIDDDSIIGLINEGPTPMARKFTDLFLAKYNDNWITFSDNSDTPDPKKVERWKTKFHFTFETNRDRYTKIIELYEQQKNNLLNQIKSQATTKFNDTPQEEGAGATDGFNSTITTHSVSADPNELVIRLKTISENYEDIYRKWINEFDFLFGEAI